MKIIERMDDFTAMVESSSFAPKYMIPILSDVKAHAAVNPLSVLFLSQEDGQKFLLLFDHNEGDKLPAECKQLLMEKLRTGCKTVFVPNKKTVLHVLPVTDPNVFVDMTALEYLATGNVPDVETIIPLTLRAFYTRFWKFSHLNRAAPLMKLLELCEAIVTRFEPIHVKFGYRPDWAVFLDTTIIPVTQFLEMRGVHVDRPKFMQHYGEKSNSLIIGNVVFTDYNPYTAAGRVSNRHGGINYAAVNKSDGTREAYTSRYERGAMVLIDWESFHLRLIANMIGFDAPKEAFHVYLAKQYFATENPTPEEYEEGKKITFQNLYSKHRRQDIPFFKAVSEWEEKTWALFDIKGYLTLPGVKVLWKDRMEDPSASKMFNYILQWMETYTAFRLIEKLVPLYKTVSSSVVLYTYDSLLIDFNMDDGSKLLRETVRVLEDGGRFPVRVYSGVSYANLKNVTEKVKN